MPQERCAVRISDIKGGFKVRLLFVPGIERERTLLIDSNRTISDLVRLSCSQDCDILTFKDTEKKVNASSQSESNILLTIPEDSQKQKYNVIIDYENSDRTCIGKVEYSLEQNRLASVFKSFKLPLNKLSPELEPIRISLIFIFILFSVVFALVIGFLTNRFIKLPVTSGIVGVIIFLLTLLIQIFIF